MNLSVSLANKQRINDLNESSDLLKELVCAALKCHQKSLVGRSVLRRRKESVFVRMGDCWLIRYQEQIAILKATRGLEYLAYLLGCPGREVHVRELLGTGINHATHALYGASRVVSSDSVTARLQYALPILDPQAKLEYKRRIDELRKDLEEAEGFSDSDRASRIRSEIDAIAERLAAAVGLGGRDRRASSDAERARSAVTKRIKEAINKIAKVLPPLGRHFADRIKTGYWCSYNPHPDRSVAWTLLLSLP